MVLGSPAGPQAAAAPLGRVSSSRHLVTLVAEAETAGAGLRAADPAAVGRLVPAARRDAARLSARLDGSPLTDATADAVDAGRPPTGLPGPPARIRASRGWAGALRLDGMATQEVVAVEYANLLACFDAEASLAEALFEEPLGVLADLHGVICQGLVDPDAVGRARRSVQAIHDGAQGRVLYDCPPPERLPGLLDALGRWLAHDSAPLPAVVVAAVVAERLLEWQPFEAANGRLARAAARTVLRARGLDPWGVAVPERVLASDPWGYYGEVAATIRRRGDLGPWAAYHAEAVVAGLWSAAAAVGAAVHDEPSGRALGLLAQLRPGEVVTVADWAARAGVSRDAAAAELRALAACGELAREPRSQGLRYRRAAAGSSRSSGQG